MREIIIIGNGVAGITAARHIRKRSEARIRVISSETEHFFSRTALMYIYMGHMKYEHTKPYEDNFWKKNKIELVYDHVDKIDFPRNIVHLKKADSEIHYDSLILALGSKPNILDWPGVQLSGVQGLYSYNDLQKMEKNTRNVKKAVVVGGGLIGIEMAEMLHSRGIATSLVVREHSFWNNVLPAEESEIINRHIRKNHVDLILKTELDQIIGDKEGKVKAVKLSNQKELEAQFVGITIGVSPNIEFLKDSLLETGRGILIDEYFQTSEKDVYAIGDCAEFRKAPADDRKNIEQVWYTGRMHGETVAATICGQKTAYKPGIWFNSAKFLDIEYQTYGTVPNGPDDDTNYHLYWEHKNGERCVRLIFNKSKSILIGVNSLGVRIRHDAVENMIKHQWPIKKVLKNLNKINFDPEFYEDYSGEIIEKYNRENPGESLKVKRKKLFKLF